MKIAFVSLHKTYGIRQIGGTDSYMRRLTYSVLQQATDLTVDWLFYGAPKAQIEHQTPTFKIHDFVKLRELSERLAIEQYDHVVIAYIHPRDRIQLILTRWRQRTTTYHFFPFFFPDAAYQRWIKFSELKIAPFSGNTYCVSPRQLRFAGKLSKRTKLLLPIVPEGYFHEPRRVAEFEQIKVVFLGRLDPRKGADKVVDLFEKLAEDQRFDCVVYGIHIPTDLQAVAIHTRLLNQKVIRYVQVERHAYKPEIDEFVSQVLKETHVFVQPYTSLDSSVDCPLLILEAMAASCAIITSDVGDVAELYGNDAFLVDNNSFFVDKAVQLLKTLSNEQIFIEQQRAHSRVETLQVHDKQIASLFLELNRS